MKFFSTAIALGAVAQAAALPSGGVSAKDVVTRAASGFRNVGYFVNWVRIR
jgi:hypothetical protein